MQSKSFFHDDAVALLLSDLQRTLVIEIYYDASSFIGGQMRSNNTSCQFKLGQ